MDTPLIFLPHSVIGGKQPMAGMAWVQMDNRFQRASDRALGELHSLYKVHFSYNQSPSNQKQKSWSSKTPT